MPSSLLSGQEALAVIVAVYDAWPRRESHRDRSVAPSPSSTPIACGPKGRSRGGGRLLPSSSPLMTPIARGPGGRPRGQEHLAVYGPVGRSRGGGTRHRRRRPLSAAPKEEPRGQGALAIVVAIGDARRLRPRRENHGGGRLLPLSTPSSPADPKGEPRAEGYCCRRRRRRRPSPAAPTEGPQGREALAVVNVVSVIDARHLRPRR